MKPIQSDSLLQFQIRVCLLATLCIGKLGPFICWLPSVEANRVFGKWCTGTMEICRDVRFLVFNAFLEIWSTPPGCSLKQNWSGQAFWLANNYSVELNNSWMPSRICQELHQQVKNLYIFQFSLDLIGNSLSISVIWLEVIYMGSLAIAYIPKEKCLLGHIYTTSGCPLSQLVAYMILKADEAVWILADLSDTFCRTLWFKSGHSYLFLKKVFQFFPNDNFTDKIMLPLPFFL